MRSSFRGILFTWLVLAVLPTAALAQETPPPTPPTQSQAPAATDKITPEQRAEVLEAIKDVMLNRAFVPGLDFSKWTEYIDKQKEELEKADDARALTNAINRALREFGASHIRLLTPRAAAARGRTTAVGSGMTTLKDGDGLKVRTVNDNGPAKGAGIEVGDVITKIDGKPAEGQEKLDGEAGSKVTLEVKKANGDVKELTIERKEFSTVRKETLTWPTEDTAVLRVFTFSAGYGRQNIEQLIEQANAKAKNLIIDLRSNGGGSTANLNHLLSLFMPEQTVIGTFVSRRIAKSYEDANKTPPTDVLKIAEWTDRKMKTAKPKVERFKGNIAVLINRGSASASEIVSAALREQAGAIVVGMPSAGAVLASTFGRLPHGFSIQYPITDYVTAKGQRLEKNPVKPDHEVTARAEEGKDPVVDKAVEALKAKKPGDGSTARRAA